MMMMNGHAGPSSGSGSATAGSTGSGTGTGSNNERPTPQKTVHHHAIRVIPEDVELSSGMQRSRSSSVQLHLPLVNSFNPGSGSASGAGRGLDETDSLLLRPVKEMDISPPLPSPSMLKPFRPNPTLRRRGIVYILAVVGSCATFIVLLIVILSSGSSSAANASIRRHAQALAQGYPASAASLSRFQSYLGSYLPFLEAYSTAGMSLTSSAILFGHVASGVHTLHPIIPILRSARTRQDNLLKKQSTNIQAAAAAYKQRYKKEPPKGYDKWWSFAKARNHTMVDEYDSMMRDLHAFSTLSPEILRQRTRTLAQLPGVSLITIKGGQAQIHSKSGKWAPALALQEMMNAFVSTLPDMEIAVNEKPEGRVLPGRWKEVNAEDWGEDEFSEEIKEGLSAFKPINSPPRRNG